MVNIMYMYIGVGICAFVFLLFLCANGLWDLIIFLLRNLLYLPRNLLYLLRYLLIRPIVYVISFLFFRCPVCKNVHHGHNSSYYINKNLCGNSLCQHAQHGSNKCTATKNITSYNVVPYVEQVPTQIGTKEEMHEEYVRICVGTENVQDWKDVSYVDNENYTDYESRTVYSYSSTNTTTERVPVTKTRSVTKTRREQYTKSIPKYENVLERKIKQIPVYEGFHNETKYRSVPVYSTVPCSCTISTTNHINKSSCTHCGCCWCSRGEERRPLLG